MNKLSKYHILMYVERCSDFVLALKFNKFYL